MTEKITVVKLDEPTSFFYAPQTKDPELNVLLSSAYQRSPMVREALFQEYAYYQQLVHDQDFLLNLNSYLWTAHTDQWDLHSLQQKTLARVDQDLIFVEKLNQSLAPYSAATGEIPWSLQTNKMKNILLGTKEIIADDMQFAALVQGHMPEGWTNAPPYPVLLGDSESLYGNSKITFISAALVETNLTLSDEAMIQNIYLPAKEDANWIDSAAIAHVVPIPDNIQPQWIDIHFAENFSFYFSDETTPQGLVFIHSGYAFGGHRMEDRYPEGKLYGPEDCSSWIAKITHCEVPFSTIDQLYTYRLGLPEGEQGYIDPNWLISEEAKTMPTLYSPVIIQDPLTDIQPGQIYFFRTFADSDHLYSPGISGHTALVIGVRENGNVVTLGYQRDMPEVEGFGISEFPWQSSGEREVMFLKVNSPLSITEVLTDHGAIPSLDGGEPSTVVPMSEPEAPFVYVYPLFEPTVNEQVIII